MPTNRNIEPLCKPETGAVLVRKNDISVRWDPAERGPLLELIRDIVDEIQFYLDQCKKDESVPQTIDLHNYKRTCTPKGVTTAQTLLDDMNQLIVVIRTYTPAQLQMLRKDPMSTLRMFVTPEPLQTSNTKQSCSDEQLDNNATTA
jgi:hypothetical protein